ncbi:uncharacterized protein DDB_G0283357 [Condylostylus longicornis]|uniref:uncharacterized protein DDB_G0283357 n=1 Tax=Condylostylus longicornis TaxID=2530218 RepID=UPI00244E0308|nr:uncharacterized protein DDB_G0283357 [Condylostylus longicornis]XP_055389455.1 uncharacterized protein DDB_G0283357 [Condylostylus longicornis]XP_055389456.1 uncharacterized protein DDB_G0283357 [Condylostylus longicornis]XP_055389457.1 uncharacterized protein DDB_G0283357 [Condylostylus longicornis]XP_055389458.1 uncharacterized protein DDB_G0283357 [Condylostylus longicornis]XP_055389459.1 uncharacterized protein DDB_G0283357 [Condylostylus longicornis]XP_055389460.1 uncharacterized prot
MGNIKQMTDSNEISRMNEKNYNTEIVMMSTATVAATTTATTEPSIIIETTAEEMKKSQCQKIKNQCEILNSITLFSPQQILEGQLLSSSPSTFSTTLKSSSSTSSSSIVSKIPSLESSSLSPLPSSSSLSLHSSSSSSLISSSLPSSTKKITLTTALSPSSTISTSILSVLSSYPALNFQPTMNFYKRIAISILVILEVLLVPVYAGPVNVRHHRMIRDIYMDLENNRPTASSQNDTQQDGTCLLDGIITKRATIHCETKPGCKAIQKTGYCCPEYQCECEKDGKLYSNGETLPDQYQTPCKVCFCKGGEIVCTNVTCYKRDDCEPKYIPGRCCPEYDNCPPLEIGKATTSKIVTGIPHNIETTDNSLQKVDQTSAASIKHPLTVHSQQTNEMPLHNPLNITIKEITKVEEIRITDAPKSTILQVHTTPNPLSNGVTNHKNGGISSTSTHVNTSLKDSQQQSLNSIEGKTIEDEIISPVAVSIPSTGESQLLNPENTKLTLVETKTILFPYNNNDKISTTIIPPSPSYSPNSIHTTETNKVLISDNNLLNGEESIKIVRHASVPTNANGENNIVQISHKTNEKGLLAGDLSNEQIGEQVVIFDKNGESKPITVFGIKGLQRGDVIEDPSLSANSNRFDDNVAKKKNKTKGSSSKEYDSNESGDIDPIQASSSDDFVRVVIGSTTENINDISNSSEEYNFTRAGEDEIYEPVLYEAFDSSSVSPSVSNSSEETFEPVHYTPEPGEIFDSIHYTPEPEAGENQSNETSDETKIYDTVYHTNDEEKVYETVYHDLENDTISTNGPENVSSEPFPFEAEDEDVNPAYPKIPEDLSIHHKINGAADYLEGNTETKSLVSHNGATIKEEPRSVIDSIHIIEDTSILSDKLKSHNNNNNNNNNNIKSHDNYDNLINLENDTSFNDIIPLSINPEPRVPGEPCLIPEWERINGTNHESRCNHTQSLIDSSIEDYPAMGLTLLKGNDSWPTSSEMDLEYGSGSGMGSIINLSSANLINNREPTTRNPNKIIDIDDFDGGSGNNININSNDTNSIINDPKNDAESLKLDDDDNNHGSGVSGISGIGIAEEINKKSAKSFYGFDSFIFY